MAQTPESRSNGLSSHDGLMMGTFFLKERMESYARQLQERGLLPDSFRLVLEDRLVYHHPLFELDRETGEIKSGAIRGNLTNIEREIVEALSRRQNQVFPHALLEQRVWGDGLHAENTSRLLKGHVQSVRGKFREIGVDPNRVLRTVHGVGYMLIDESLDFNFNFVDLKEKVNASDKEQKEPVGVGPEVHKFSHFDYHPTGLSIKVGEEWIYLTAAENRILACLAVNLNLPVSRDVLAEFSRGEDLASLENYIGRLRRKINSGRKLNEPTIITIIEYGYMLIDFSKMPKGRAESIKRNLSGSKLRTSL